MTEQGGIRGDLSPDNMSQQGQGYSLGIHNMDVMDEMVLGGIGNSPQRISDMDRTGDNVDSLAPIFPPQNFDVPDISFSNSVSPNVDFNQSLLSSANMYGGSNTVYTTVNASSGHMVGAQSVGHNQLQQGHQQPLTYFPTASRSPPGSSSSDDSDDLPLAQLAKRAVIGHTATHAAGTSASVASPSAPSTDTTSMEGSPVSGAASKKAKQTKRKKKKDPNEPQKPVSAYALFFRDTQATIKGHNPSASFGEVSKIVASMWDQLDPEHKDVYKKKTEMAKKQYLKQLAAYRASQVSQSASEEAEKSPSPTGVGSHGGVSGATSFQAMGTGPPPGQMMGQQRLHMQQQSPQHLMQMSPQMMQQQQQQQQQMQQQIQQQLLQQQQQQMNISQPSPLHQHSPPQEMSTVSGSYTSPQHVGQTVSTGYQPTVVNHNNAFGFSDSDMNMEVNYPQCVRSGCGNHARENPAWDSEYCSNDCVITHCRDIFKTWVASRSGTNAYPVK